MLGIDWLEWLGYAASAVVVVSLMMSSLVRLRWVNLVGASLFSAYGFLIGAIPVGVLNGAIAVIDVYYLARFHGGRDHFRVVIVEPGSGYLRHFLEFHRAEIFELFPDFDFETRGRSLVLFVLRNTVPAGLFVASVERDGDLRVDVDFVTREHRDFKVGEFLFTEGAELLARTGCDRAVARAHRRRHERYLRKMGFEPVEGESGLFARRIELPAGA